MRVKIIRFRYIKELNLDFSAGKVTLLQGDSGTGKSTVMEAIKWCIYGKMQHIYHFDAPGSDKLQTSVLIEFPELGGISLYRSKPPDVFKMCIPNPQNLNSGGEPYYLTGAAGESYIKNILGSKMVWIASSYIAQNERSPIMTLSNSEKLELLLESTFGAEYKESSIPGVSPDWFLEKVDSEIVKCKEYNQYLTQQYNMSLNNLNLRLKDPNLSNQMQLWSKEPSKEDIVDLSKNIQDNSSKLQTLRSELLKSKDIEARKDLLLASLNEINIRLTKIYEIGEKFKNDGLPYMSNQIQEYILIKQSLEQLDQLRMTDPSKGFVFPPELINLNQQQLSDKLNKNYKDLSEYNRSLKICQDQKLDYNKQVIDTILTKAGETIFTQEKLKKDIEENKRRLDYKIGIENEILRLENDIKTRRDIMEKSRKWWEETCVKLNMSGTTPYESNEMSKIISFLQNQKSPAVLTCPCCNKELEYKDNKLYILNSKPFDKIFSQEVIQACYDLSYNLSELNENIKRKNYAEENLKKCLPFIEIPPNSAEFKILSPQELGSLKSLLVLVSTITYPLQVSPEVVIEENKTISLTIETIKWRQNFQFMETKCNSLSGKEIPVLFPKIIEISISDLQKRVSDLIDYQSKSRNISDEYTRINSELHKLPNVIPSITFINDISKLEVEIKTMQDKYSSGLNIREICLQREDLVNKQSILVGITSRETTLNRLKAFINEVTNRALQEMVDQVNSAVNAIINDLFQNGMNVELKLFRQLKTSDRVKSEVNLGIIHRGLVYDSPNHLSGGEKDRLSLALTLALARVSPSPVVFLDECMSSLNESLRVSCIEAIKKYVPHKTIVNICHEIVEGHHDNFIAL